VLVKTTPLEHVHLQQQSGTPPDVYAARAGLTCKSLRVYAAQHHTQLNMRLHTEARAWWEETLKRLDPTKLQAFCITEDVPVKLVAYWYHRIYTPQDTLLWGYNSLRVLSADLFDDVARFNNDYAPTHVLARGKAIAHVDLRVAAEAFKHSRAYNYQQC
jgi:hypothetical protein